MRRTLLTVLVTMSALNGCSSSGDDRSDAPDRPDTAISEEAYVDAVAATFHGSDGRPVTPAARACLEAHISQNPDEALRLAGNQDELATFFGDLATSCHPIFPP